MLFGTNAAVSLGPGLDIRRSGTGVMLTWPTGPRILQQADAATGPYISLDNAISPYFVTNLSRQKFYRLGPVE